MLSKMFAEILPKCIAFLISVSNITNNTDPRTTTVKKLKALISKYYEYNHLEVNSFVKELITILQSKHIFHTLFFVCLCIKIIFLS